MLRRSLIYLTSGLKSLVRQKLWFQVLLGMFLGVIFGILIGPTFAFVAPKTSELISAWVALPGKLFLLVIQFVIIPLIVASVIRGIAGGDNSQNIGKVSFLTISFFIVTTIIAVIIGILLALLIKPGDYIDSSLLSNISVVAHTSHNVQKIPNLAEFPDSLVSLFPKDPLMSFVSGNMLQTVITAIIIAMALVAMKPAQKKPILDLLSSIQEVCMVIIGWALRFVPYAVFGLIANISAQIGIATLLAMMVYVLTVLVGLLILLVGYLTILFVVKKQNPWHFLKVSKEVILLALSTSSSAAVMPLTLDVCEKKFAVKTNISRFVIPLGTTINMAGTALYQGVACIFLAQVFQVEISISAMILIIVMAVGASVGSAGAPGVSIVILATILESVGIPSAGIALIIGVDRILDMCRTAVNVTGDISAAILLNKK